MLKKLLPILLILLLAATLRGYRLTEVPPGLTHDEANHGREAIEILDGVLRYYFPLNYGSEPLYSYTVAGSMALLGENLLALRLVNVIFGLAAIAMTFVWAREAFERRTALVTAVLMAISFWPLAASREALRAGMLPFFMALAVWCLWRILFGNGKRRGWFVAGFALSIVAMLHIYLAARVAWLVFPAFLLYLAVVERDTFRRGWRPVLSGLFVAGLLVVPMFVYLAYNPDSQTRLSMLSRPLEQITSGEWLPILQNAGEALLAFVWPGFGDQFLAYNIPGRPVLDVVSAVFFLLGLGVSVWRWKRPSHALLLLWFLIGIIPSLVTGPTANTTRNLAALPALYLLTTMGFVALVDWLTARVRWNGRVVAVGLASAWLLFAGFITLRDYFVRWGESPAVRSAYQHTLVEELSFLEAQGLKGRPVTLSTVYPGPAHDASLALVLAGDASRALNWVDARGALLFPPDRPAYAITTTATPPHVAFDPYLQPLETIQLRPDDLDPAFTLHALDVDAAAALRAQAPLARFGNAVALMEARWLDESAAPGSTAELLTVWHVLDPTGVGPSHSPTNTTDAAIFVHVLDDADQIVAQSDALDAPSWAWEEGDIVLQVHSVTLPPALAAGRYAAMLGIYDRVTGVRLPVLPPGAGAGDTREPLPPLEVD